MKRFLCVLLCLVLLLTALPVTPQAKEAEEAQQEMTQEEIVRKEAKRSYYRARATARKKSFHGYCGTMTSHQLYALGINTGWIVLNGRDQYNYYRDMEVTSGGYYIMPYDAEDFTLLEALRAITDDGTRDARNIMVGFQWTKTSEGRKYGHSLVINAILNGTVYFVESFHCPLGGPEGTVITCSIEEFANYFSKWTRFEGLIHFGSGRYSDVCRDVSTDLFVQTRFAGTLRSEPSLVGTKGCVRLRNLAAGELLRVNGIVYGDRGNYYRVLTNEGVGYVSTACVSVVQASGESASLTGLTLPENCESGQSVKLGGTVTAAYGSVAAVEVCVWDQQGQPVLRERIDTPSGVGKLSDLNDALYFYLLEQGVYRVEIYADCACPWLQGSQIQTYYQRVFLTSRNLQVGPLLPDWAIDLSQEKLDQDGWVRKKGTWYRYADGAPCTGWQTVCGVQYYFNADGAVTTGWALVDGRQVYFTAGGAMVTGWLTVDGITYYRAADGTALTGWQQLDGGLYCFTEEGELVTGGEMTKDDTVYVLAKDGKATVKES